MVHRGGAFFRHVISRVCICKVYMLIGFVDGNPSPEPKTVVTVFVFMAWLFPFEAPRTSFASSLMGLAVARPTCWFGARLRIEAADAVSIFKSADADLVSL